MPFSQRDVLFKSEEVNFATLQQQALLAMRQKHYLAAALYYNKSLPFSPDKFQTTMMIAEALRKGLRHSRAVPLLKELYATDPSYPGLASQLGTILLESLHTNISLNYTECMEHYQEIRAYFVHSFKLQPHEPKTLLQLATLAYRTGTTQLKEGNKEEACAAFQESLYWLKLGEKTLQQAGNMHPEFREYMYLLQGNIYRRLGKDLHHFIREPLDNFPYASLQEAKNWCLKQADHFYQHARLCSPISTVDHKMKKDHLTQQLTLWQQYNASCEEKEMTAFPETLVMLANHCFNASPVRAKAIMQQWMDSYTVAPLQEELDILALLMKKKPEWAIYIINGISISHYDLRVNDARSYYNNRHSIVISCAHEQSFLASDMGCLIHEISHALQNALYGQSSLPAYEKEVLGAMRKTLEHIAQIVLPVPSGPQRTALHTLSEQALATSINKELFTISPGVKNLLTDRQKHMIRIVTDMVCAYPQYQLPAEAAVCIPQLLGEGYKPSELTLLQPLYDCYCQITKPALKQFKEQLENSSTLPAPQKIFTASHTEQYLRAVQKLIPSSSPSLS